MRHRYRDFVELNEQLSAARLDLQLPKKKVFGNMDKNFIEDRRQGLQVRSVAGGDGQRGWAGWGEVAGGGGQRQGGGV